MLLDEKEFKKGLINKLNTINPGWVDGDEDIARFRKADIVNHSLKIAIEVKDDTHYKFPKSDKKMTSISIDLDRMNRRFTDHLRSANNKFKEYLNYKTILLIRTEFTKVDIIRHSIEGLRSYNLPFGGEKLKYIGRKTKYSEYIRKNTGCCLIFNPEVYYCPNQFARQERILKKEEVEKIFDLELKDIPQI